MTTYTKADGSTGKVPRKIKGKGGAKKSAAKKRAGSKRKRAPSAGGKGLAERVSKLEKRMTRSEKRTDKLEAFAVGISGVVGRRYKKTK